jgi:putative secretion ATPase (PEP-CTERM system associated)
MHEAFYHFSSEPFRLSPDPKFRYPHRTYRKAMTYMRHALHRAEGFIIITGQPGMGKTTLINDLLQELKTDKVNVAKLVSTQLKADDLLRLMAYSFGLDPEGRDKAAVLNRVEQYLEQQYKQGRRSLLIVDEAQDVPEDALEELRLLTNLQVDSHPLLQIFLVGQAELRDLVSAPALVQLHQRVIAATHIDPLDNADTRAYIQHRLQKVGWSGNPAFSEEIYTMVYRFSGGIPRQINQICNRLLLHGAIEEKHRLGIQDLKTVVEELRLELLLPAGMQEIADMVVWPEEPVEETYEVTPPPRPSSPAPNQAPPAETQNTAASRGRMDKDGAVEPLPDAESDVPAAETQNTATRRGGMDKDGAVGPLPDAEPDEPAAETQNTARRRGGLDKDGAVGPLPDAEPDESAHAPASTPGLPRVEATPTPRLAIPPGDQQSRPVRPHATRLPGEKKVSRIPLRKRRGWQLSGLMVVFAGLLIALMYASGFDMTRLMDGKLVSRFDPANYFDPGNNKISKSTNPPIIKPPITKPSIIKPSIIKPSTINSPIIIPETGPGQAAGPAAQTPETAPEQDKQTEVATKAPEPDTTASSETMTRYGPVKHNETLWSIAKKLQPDNNFSTQQMMLALQRANPDAFIDNDINNLLVGSVLRVPKRIEQIAPAPEKPKRVERAAPAPEKPKRAERTAPAPDRNRLVAEQFVIEQELRRKGVIVERLEGDLLRVKLRSDGLFDFDSARIRDSAGPDLQTLAEVLRKYQHMMVQVVGHTDSTGQADYNLSLSKLRAIAVADYLVDHDLPGSRIHSEGRGDRDTRLEKSPNDSPETKRRVEIYIRPAQGDGIEPGFMALPDQGGNL